MGMVWLYGGAQTIAHNFLLVSPEAGQAEATPELSLRTSFAIGQAEVSLLGMVWFIGFMIGVVVFTGDSLGRKGSMNVTMVIQQFAAMVFPFASSYYVILFLRLILGMCNGAVGMVAFLLIIEIAATPRERAVFSVGLHIFFSVGACACAVVSWLINEKGFMEEFFGGSSFYESMFPEGWRRTSFILSLFGNVIYLCVFLRVLESPRWLFFNGKLSRFQKTITKLRWRSNLPYLTPEEEHSIITVALIENIKICEKEDGDSSRRQLLDEEINEAENTNEITENEISTTTEITQSVQKQFENNTRFSSSPVLAPEATYSPQQQKKVKALQKLNFGNKNKDYQKLKPTLSEGTLSSASASHSSTAPALKVGAELSDFTSDVSAATSSSFNDDNLELGKDDLVAGSGAKIQIVTNSTSGDKYKAQAGKGFSSSQNSEDKGSALFQLVSNAMHRKRLFIFMISWFSVCMTFYGLTFSADQLAKDIFADEFGGGASVSNSAGNEKSSESSKTNVDSIQTTTDKTDEKNENKNENITNSKNDKVTNEKENDDTIHTRLLRHLDENTTRHKYTDSNPNTDTDTNTIKKTTIFRNTATSDQSPQQDKATSFYQSTHESLHGPYLISALSALIEAPACLLSMGLIEMERFGRKTTTSVFFALAGIFCLVLYGFLEGVGTPFTDANASTNQTTSDSITNPLKTFSDEQKTTMLVAILSGKFAASIAFSVVYTYGTELFPTNLRGTALGLQNFSARTGGMLCAPILAADENGGHNSLLIFTCCCFLSAASTVMFLPETKGK